MRRFVISVFFPWNGEVRAEPGAEGDQEAAWGSKVAMPQPRLSKRMGNRWMLALEFEIHDGSASTWNETWGSLWLWVEGRLIGRPFESEMVFTGLESLREAAQETGQRGRDLLPTDNLKEALDVVMWARYGGDDSLVRGLTIHEESLLPFEILPRRTGPFFDGWQGILVEEGAAERFILRQEGGEVTDAVWPLGTFRDVIQDGCREFERLARSPLKEATSP